MPRLRAYYDVPTSEWVLPGDKAEAAHVSVPRKASPTRRREAVRQWLLRELVDSYHFPAAWLGGRICPVGGDEEPASPDELFGVTVSTSRGHPFLYAGVEDPGRAAQAEAAVRVALTADPYAGMGLSTDGSAEGTRFLRRRFDADRCEYIPDLEAYTPPGLAAGAQPYRAPREGAADGPAPSSLSDRVANVFFEAHSHIRDIDGKHADGALDELCKVLYAKLYDEETTAPGECYRLQRWVYGSTEELAAACRQTYREAAEYDTRVYALRIPGYTRSRGVFNTQIRLSSPALAKVIQTLQDYDFTRSRADVKGRAFQRVLSPAVRAGMGQYFTPDAVVRFMVGVADPQPADLILDPFAGSGRFLTGSLDWVRNRWGQEDPQVVASFAFTRLHGIEKSETMVRIAMTDMRLHGDGHSNIRCVDALLEFANYPDLQPESFDIVLTNPPFGSMLGKAALAQLAAFTLPQGRSSVPLEVLGLERSIEFLRSGGRLAIVLPDGLLANRGSSYVRDWLEEQVRLRAIVSLPIQTFSPFGANVKTSVLFATKWRAGEQRSLGYDIFLGRVDNVGYDASGRASDGAEFDELARELKQFLAAEGW